MKNPELKLVINNKPDSIDDRVRRLEERECRIQERIAALRKDILILDPPDKFKLLNELSIISM